jgi:hypothetical protein
MNSGHGKSAIVTSFDRQIANGSDNALRDYSGGYGGGFAIWAPLFIGESSTSYTTCLRFLSIAIPKNAIIDVAYITVRSQYNLSAVRVNTRIFIEASDNPSTFSTLADFNTRSVYSNPVTWNDIPAWNDGGLFGNVGNNYNTPSLTTLVQTVVNRTSWVSGGAMAFFIADNSTDWSDYHANRCIINFSGNSSLAAILHIEYHV